MDRIRKLCSNSKFLARFFSADEIRYIVSRELSTSIIAENYCAKIAFAKAIGTGMRIVKPSEISILRDASMQACSPSLDPTVKGKYPILKAVF